MAATLLHLSCSQCGAEAPQDRATLSSWMHGRIALTGEFPEVISSLLLCPACVAEEHAFDYDEGTGD